MRQFVLLLSALLLLSCRSGRETEAILSCSEKMMQDRPEEALKILETIDAPHLPNTPLRAKYALLYSQALDKNYIDIANDSLITIAVNYYDRNGASRDKALAYYYLGRVCVNAGDTERAIEAFTNSANAAQDTEHYYLQGLINSSIGNLLQSQYSLQDALASYRRAAEFFRKSNRPRIEAQMLTSQAENLYRLDQCDSAFLKWDEATAIYKELHANHEIEVINEQIAVFRLDHNDDIAQIKKNLWESYARYSGGEIPVRSLGLWQSIYLKERNLDSARLCGLRMLGHRENLSLSRIAGCLVLLDQIEYLAGNYKKSCDYSHEASRIIDSANAIKQDKLIQDIEQKYNAKILTASLANLQSRHTYQTIIFILVLIIFIAGAVLTAVLTIRWRRKAAYELDCAQSEVKRLSTTYSELQVQLEALSASIDTGNEQEFRLFKALEERLMGLRDLVDEAGSVKPALFEKKFQKYMAVNVNSAFALSDLQYVVNKKYYGVIDYLKSEYPELNKHDLDLCSLLCFGFSQFGICYIYHYNDIGSFYNKRSRLRRKLHIPQDYKIEDFIRDVLKRLSQKSNN